MKLTVGGQPTRLSAQRLCGWERVGTINKATGASTGPDREIMPMSLVENGYLIMPAVYGHRFASWRWAPFHGNQKVERVSASIHLTAACPRFRLSLDDEECKCWKSENATVGRTKYRKGRGLRRCAGNGEQYRSNVTHVTPCTAPSTGVPISGRALATHNGRDCYPPSQPSNGSFNADCPSSDSLDFLSFHLLSSSLCLSQPWKIHRLNTPATFSTHRSLSRDTSLADTIPSASAILSKIIATLYITSSRGEDSPPSGLPMTICAPQMPSCPKPHG